MNSEPSELRIEIPGLSLAARVWGSPDAPPVLAIHGWQDNAATFDLLAPKLGDVRIVAIDLPGHGRSEHRPAGTAYTFLDWVIDTHAVIDALGWTRCAILGHSLGAGIANAVAATWPARISRIAAIDGFAPRTDVASAAPQTLAAHVRARNQIRSRGPRTFVDLDAATARLLERVDGLTEIGARLLAGRGTESTGNGAEVTWRRDPSIQAGPLMRLSREQIEAFLARVSCPVLLVRPRSGWPIADEVLRDLQQLIGADLIRIESMNGGHHVHLEDPATVARWVAPFLNATH